MLIYSILKEKGPFIVVNKNFRAEFATPNETVLRQQLVEFCDHNLINLSRDGSIKLCVDQNLLIQFLEKNN